MNHHVMRKVVCGVNRLIKALLGASIMTTTRSLAETALTVHHALPRLIVTQNQVQAKVVAMIEDVSGVHLMLMVNHGVLSKAMILAVLPLQLLLKGQLLDQLTHL